jgi:pyrroloquinoline quinone biosynthesis protein B
VTLTHHHLGHVDGIGLFGREVMGKPNKSIRLISSKAVIDDLEKKSFLDPFAPEIISNGSHVELGKGVSLEFHRVPHRECELGETYGIIVRGKQNNIFFLPDHDTYLETLNYHKKNSIREWLKSLEVDVALIDGTFFTLEEISGERSDSKGIPHPTISESMALLGKRVEDDPDIIFIHLNHTNPVIDDEMERLEIEELGWKIGSQGQVWII